MTSEEAYIEWQNGVIAEISETKRAAAKRGEVVEKKSKSVGGAGGSSEGGSKMISGFKKEHTKVTHEEGCTKVYLHGTLIVSFTDDTITLYVRGYRSALIKRRMNDVAEYFNLGYVVHKKDNNWFVLHEGMSVRWGRTDTFNLTRKRNTEWKK